MDISIIICTYNPNESIFRRCLAAVQQLKKKGLETEIILVDNNSSPALDEVGYIQTFLTGNPEAKYIKEATPGLTYARITGFANAAAPLIVFFDDDNEPDENYLLATHDVFSRRPDVGMLGPGIIHVDFIDGSNKWLETKRETFQEKKILQETFGTSTEKYQLFYPYGTGLAVRRDVVEKYYTLVKKQDEVLGRKGNSLISGEDVQMVWTGIVAGYAAGCTPALKVNHLIPGSRTTEAYIKKLHYSLGYSDDKMLLGVFPEREAAIRQKKRSFFEFYFILIKCMIRNLFNQKLLQTELIPSFLGKTSAYYYAFNEKKPWWLQATEKIFGLNYYN